jgi:hypothetical protein
MVSEQTHAANRAAIHECFVANYGLFQSAAYEQWPGLSAFGSEQILNALAANLYRYRRPTGDGLIRWATAWVRREARRHRFLVEQFDKNWHLIAAAIQRSLHGPLEDRAVEVKDHIADIRLHLLENPRKIDVLLKPKKAKSSSLLYRLAKDRMWGYKSKLGDRRALVGDWMADLSDSGMTGDRPDKLDAYEKKSMRYEVLGAR